MLLYLTAMRVVALSMTHLFSSRHLAAALTGLIITSMALVSGYIVHPEEVGWWAQWFKYVSPQWWLQHPIVQDEFHPVSRFGCSGNPVIKTNQGNILISRIFFLFLLVIFWFHDFFFYFYLQYFDFTNFFSIFILNILILQFFFCNILISRTFFSRNYSTNILWNTHRTSCHKLLQIFGYGFCRSENSRCLWIYILEQARSSMPGQAIVGQIIFSVAFHEFSWFSANFNHCTLLCPLSITRCCIFLV